MHFPPDSRYSLPIITSNDAVEVQDSTVSYVILYISYPYVKDIPSRQRYTIFLMMYFVSSKRRVPCIVPVCRVICVLKWPLWLVQYTLTSLVLSSNLFIPRHVIRFLSSSKRYWCSCLLTPGVSTINLLCWRSRCIRVSSVITLIVCTLSIVFLGRLRTCLTSSHRTLLSIWFLYSSFVSYHWEFWLHH